MEGDCNQMESPHEAPSDKGMCDQGPVYETAYQEVAEVSLNYILSQTLISLCLTNTGQ